MKASETRFDAVIFDMDGVLIDARNWHFEALNEALSLFGEQISVDEHLERFDGLPTRIKLEMLTNEGRLPAHVHRIVSQVKQERTLRIASQQNKPDLQHLILIGWLRSRGVKVAVATNSIRLTTQQMLQSASLLKEMSAVVTNEDVLSPKPAPDVYLECARIMSVDPKRCLVVEDNEAGVAAANNAGMEVIRVEGPSMVSLNLVRDYFEVGV